MYAQPLRADAVRLFPRMPAKSVFSPCGVIDRWTASLRSEASSAGGGEVEVITTSAQRISSAIRSPPRAPSSSRSERLFQLA